MHLRVSVKCDLLLSHFEVSWFECKEIGRHENVEEMKSGEEMKELEAERHCTSAVFKILGGYKKKTLRETVLFFCLKRELSLRPELIFVQFGYASMRNYKKLTTNCSALCI